MGSYHPHFRRHVNNPSVMSDSPAYNPGDGPPFGADNFDLIDWYPAHQSCLRYFLNHAQHEPSTHALCAFINIRLPFQYADQSVMAAASTLAASNSTNQSYDFNFTQPGSTPTQRQSATHDERGERSAFVSLIPYIRRLVVTNFDTPAILHGFFGDDWERGVLPFVACERRNYLFAAKSGGWRSCKRQYDGGSGHGGEDESVPFLAPLGRTRVDELTSAEKAWSNWLCMEDWILGPRAPEDENMASANGATAGRLNSTLQDSPNDDSAEL